MSETDPTYPVMEAAISLEAFADLTSGHERKQEGDIISIREPVGFIGFKEAETYLWLKLEGLEEDEMNLLIESLYDGGEVYDKRRYLISLDRLKELEPTFDLNRARDVDDLYQPFLTLDEDTHQLITENSQPLQISGLVFDKSIGDYL